MRSEIINNTLTSLNDHLSVARDVLGAIESGFSSENAGTGTEKEHLISKDSVISLSSSDSESEFDDIIPKRRTNAQTAHHERRVTNTGTMFHLLKANIWTGLLAMPKAMSHFGLLAGVLGILILGSIYIYCIHLLLDINRAIVKRVMLDRDIERTNTVLAMLQKELRKMEKRMSRKMKKEAKGCVNAVEKDYTTPAHWKKKYSEDFEVGESSSKKDDSNKTFAHCKKKYSEVFEVGESSSSKKDDSNKSSTKLKGKCAKYIELRESSSSNEDISKKSSTKLKKQCTADIEVRESSSSNGDISKKKRTNVKERNAKDFGVGESSSSKKDNSKKSSTKLKKQYTADIEVRKSSSNGDISKKKHTNVKEGNAKDSGVGETSSPKKDNSEKSSTKLKKQCTVDIEVQESSSSNGDISKKKHTNAKERNTKDSRVGESSSSTKDNSEKKETNLKERNDKDSELEASSSKKDGSDKSSTKLKEKCAKDIEVEESSLSNEDISKKKRINMEQTNAKDSEVEESSSSKKNGSKKKLTTWKKKDMENFKVRESSSSKKDHSNKSSTKLKEMCAIDIELKESSSSNENISKNVNALFEYLHKKSTWKKKYSKDLEVEESSSSKEDHSDKNSQEQNNTQSDEVLIEFSQQCSEDMILRTLDYPKLVELSFHYGMEQFRWAGKIVKFYVQALMLFTHIGCCCVCFLFVAESLGEMATKGPFTHFNSFQMVGYAVPIMICLSFIPDRHELTGVTTIAVLLQLSGVFMMLYYFFQGDHNESLNLYIAPAETWYLYFGIIFYAFEGTGVTLHLESHMEKKKDLRGWNGILNKSMFFVIPLYAVFGALGYWKIGNDIKTSVTFNLPEERLTDLIQVMTAIGILLTYPFHLSFVLTPIKKMFIQDDFGETTKQVLDLVLRAILVICTFVISALTPYLELQLTVLGASASCFLILVIPPYMSVNSYNQLYDLDYSCCRMLFHTAILLIGTAGTVLGSYITFKNLHLYYPNATIFE